MSLRVASALALVLGAGIFLGYLHWVGKSPWSSPAERHLRAMKDRTEAPATLAPISFAAFVGLPHARPLAEVAELERRAVSLEGYVQGMFVSSDGDLCLSLVDSLPPAGAPAPLGVTAEITPQWHRGSRTWSWEPLNAAFRPYSGWYAPWPEPPARVRISGWLLYDFEYDAPYVEEKRPLLPDPEGSRLTGWEIHPVTRIERWDDSTAAYVELAR